MLEYINDMLSREFWFPTPRMVDLMTEYFTNMNLLKQSNIDGVFESSLRKMLELGDVLKQEPKCTQSYTINVDQVPEFDKTVEMISPYSEVVASYHRAVNSSY